MSKNIKDIETLVVGGSFSTIPLLRELDRTGNEYIVVNAGRPIWSRLDENNRLDFDLVSSLYTSLFSFELVELMKQGKDLTDGYPTSKEFYSIIKKYRKIYESKTVTATVTQIDNYEDHSIVHIDNGDKYKAKNVVVATAFRRKVSKTISNFEFNESLKDKTVVLTTIGDSANLLISKLVCFGAKVKLVSNGFEALDKEFHHEQFSKSGVATVDQFECHNIAKAIPALYEPYFSVGYWQSFILPKRIVDFLYGPISFATEHPLSIRKSSKKAIWKIYRNIYLRLIPFIKVPRSPANGDILIKYWPIDVYEKRFSNDLELNIADGFLLNDLVFYIDQGFVELWDKSQTRIDKESLTLESNGKKVNYDYLVEGGGETPNLPSINYQDSDDKQRSYSYTYRENFMGVIPAELNNIYLVGYTRPFTGGLSNLAEMQCLFVHKLVTQEKFKKEVTDDIGNKIAAYNTKCYASEEATPSDHLVFFGFYTEDIAELMGIQPKLRDCKSALDVAKLYLFPNNSHYYRQRGEYAVDGARELVDYISDQHHHFFATIPGYILYTIMYATFFITVFLLPIPLWASALISIILALPFSLITALIMGNCGIPNSKKPFIYDGLHFVIFPVGVGAALYFSNWIFAAAALLSSFALIKFCTKRGMNRHIFCDVRVRRRPEYKEFFVKYRTAFLEVFRKKGSTQATHLCD